MRLNLHSLKAYQRLVSKFAAAIPANPADSQVPRATAASSTSTNASASPQHLRAMKAEALLHSTGRAGFLIGLVMSVYSPVLALSFGALGACLLLAACFVAEARAA